MVCEFQMLVISVFLKSFVKYSQIKRMLLSIPRNVFGSFSHKKKQIFSRVSHTQSHMQKTIVSNNYLDPIYINFLVPSGK